MSKGYNKRDYEEIVSLFKKNRFKECLELVEDYINEYPNDIKLYGYYVRLLTMFGHFEKTELFIRKNIDKIPETNTIHKIMLRNWMYSYSYRGNYDEAYDMLECYKDLFTKEGWDYTYYKLFLKSRLGMLSTKDLSDAEMNRYVFRQIATYKEHIMLSMVNNIHYNGQIKDSILNCYFYEDNNPEKLLEIIKANLNDAPFTYQDGYGASYIFKYDNVGKINNKNVNYILVVTMIDTNDIITFEPYCNIENAPFIDITPELEESNVKKLSRIDKFNQKYGMK